MLSRLMTVREQWLLLGLAAAIVLGAGVLIWRGNSPQDTKADTFVPRVEGRGTPLPAPETAPPSPVTVAAVSAAPLDAPPEPIAVGILGAVAREGLYYFEPGARITDLLQAAGGPLPQSDLSDINRTALLMDETTLLVPEWIVEDGQRYSYPATTYNPEAYTRSTWYQFDDPGAKNNAPGVTSAATVSGGEPRSPQGLVNINRASQRELESLPGIGPVTAQKIMVHREHQPFNTIDDLERVSGIGPAKMAAVRSLITVN